MNTSSVLEDFDEDQEDDYNDDDDNDDDDDDLTHRLAQIQRSLKATQAAPATTRPLREEENHDPNASFHLGVELFGQEPAMVERKLQESLTHLEQDLSKLLREATATSSSDTTAASSSALPPTRTGLQEEGRQLQMKIAFFQTCSVARAKLDDSQTASSVLAAGHEPDMRLAVQALVEASDALDQAQAMVDAQRRIAATMQPLLAPADKMLDAIRSALRQQRAALVAWARKELSTCVRLEANRLLVRAGPALTQAYQVLEVLAAQQDHPALDDVLAQWTRQLYTSVFAPLLQANGGSAWEFQEAEDRAQTSLTTVVTTTVTKGTVRRLEWSRPDQDELHDDDKKTTEQSNVPNVGAWKEIFAFIERILDFLTDRVLLNRETLCAHVGKRLFGKPGAMPEELNLEAIGIESCRMGDDHGLLLEPLVKALNETCIPAYLKPDETNTLFSMGSELAGMLDPFLEHVASKNLLPQDGETRLSSFASMFETKYIDNRRCIVLNEARKLLLQNDYHNTVQVGVDVVPSKKEKLLRIDNGLAVFLLHKSSVSDTAYKLMQLCRRTMDEAVEQQAAHGDSPLALLPPTLYRSAREVLDLFRAIIPVTHGHEIATVPRTAAVLHNDCVFLAHHCGTLGLEYKEKFPPAQPDDTRGGLLRQTCMFVDMVPLFRDLADRAMGDMLDVQARQLVDLVGARIASLGVALRSDTIVPAWAEAETALEASLYHLRHLSQAWQPVLAADVLNRSLCFLADVLFGLFLDPLGQATDISANACQFVGTLYEKATRDVGALVGGKDDSTDEDDVYSNKSRLWSRFAAMGRFFDMSLAEIQVALSDGVFQNVTGPELSRLITACFDDSPKRRNVLYLLSSSSTTTNQQPHHGQYQK